MTAPEFAAQHGDGPWTTADCETCQNLAQVDLARVHAEDRRDYESQAPARAQHHAATR